MQEERTGLTPEVRNEGATNRRLAALQHWRDQYGVHGAAAGLACTNQAGIAKQPRRRLNSGIGSRAFGRRKLRATGQRRIKPPFPAGHLRSVKIV